MSIQKNKMTLKDNIITVFIIINIIAFTIVQLYFSIPLIKNKIDIVYKKIYNYLFDFNVNYENYNLNDNKNTHNKNSNSIYENFQSKSFTKRNRVTRLLKSKSIYPNSRLTDDEKVRFFLNEPYKNKETNNNDISDIIGYENIHKEINNKFLNIIENDNVINEMLDSIKINYKLDRPNNTFMITFVPYINLNLISEKINKLIPKLLDSFTSFKITNEGKAKRVIKFLNRNMHLLLKVRNINDIMYFNKNKNNKITTKNNTVFYYNFKSIKSKLLHSLAIEYLEQKPIDIENIEVSFCLRVDHLHKPLELLIKKIEI